MNKLSKLLRLPLAKKLLLLRAAFCLSSVIVALHTLPFRRVQRWFEELKVTSTSPHMALEDILWSVRAVSRRSSRATCLPQALCAVWMLRAEGYAANFQIGVAREGSELKAHAWVEVANRVVIGGTGSPDEYTTILVQET